MDACVRGSGDGRMFCLNLLTILFPDCCSSQAYTSFENYCVVCWDPPDFLISVLANMPLCFCCFPRSRLAWLQIQHLPPWTPIRTSVFTSTARKITPSQSHCEAWTVMRWEIIGARPHPWPLWVPSPCLGLDLKVWPGHSWRDYDSKPCQSSWNVSHP